MNKIRQRLICFELGNRSNPFVKLLTSVNKIKNVYLPGYIYIAKIVLDILMHYFDTSKEVCPMYAMYAKILMFSLHLCTYMYFITFMYVRKCNENINVYKYIKYRASLLWIICGCFSFLQYYITFLY